jgi:hypothetical protein
MYLLSHTCRWRFGVQPEVRWEKLGFHKHNCERFNNNSLHLLLQVYTNLDTPTQPMLMNPMITTMALLLLCSSSLAQTTQQQPTKLTTWPTCDSGKVFDTVAAKQAASSKHNLLQHYHHKTEVHHEVQSLTSMPEHPMLLAPPCNKVLCLLQHMQGNQLKTSTLQW